MMKNILMLITIASLLARTASADIWDDLAKYKMGDEGTPIPDQVHELINKTPLDQRGPIEVALIKIIESKSSTEHAKWFSCRMLQRVGTEKCVPTLAPLLTDERRSHFARLALERMTDSDQAGAALRNALKSAPNTLKPGLMGSIGERRDAQAIGQIKVLVASSDPLVSVGALQALGKIGGQEGKQALENVNVTGELQTAWFDAYLMYAERAKDAGAFQNVYDDSGDDKYRAAALVGLLATGDPQGLSIAMQSLKGEDSILRRTALRCVVVEPSPQLTKAVTGMLSGLDTDRQTELVSLLGERGDRAALASVSKFLDSDDPKLRGAAIVAVGLLGDANSVKPLLIQANVEEYNQLAIESIASITDKGADEVLLNALSDNRLKISAMQGVARRHVVKGVPQLLVLTDDGWPRVRDVAWKSLSIMATPDNLEEMMKRMLAYENKSEKSQAQQSMKTVCDRASDKNACLDAVGGFYRDSDEAVKLFVLEIAGAAGGSKALEITRSALKSGNPTLYEKAVRTLISWPSDAAMPDLLALANTAPENVTRILSLQGYIKLADKIGDHRKKMEALKACQDLVTRVEEKRILIMALKNTRHPAALAMLSGYLDDAEVRKEAQQAVVDLSQQLVKNHRPEVAAATEKVINASGVNQDVLKKAQDLHKQVTAKK